SPMPQQDASAKQTVATAKTLRPRQHALAPPDADRFGQDWTLSIIERTRSPCIGRGVDVPGGRSNCNRPVTARRDGQETPGMLWPFNSFRGPDRSPAPTIEAIYGMIVTRVRKPVFYRDFGVPDTVEGRFDLLLLHLWMVLRRLRTAEGGVEPAQALF